MFSSLFSQKVFQQKQQLDLFMFTMCIQTFRQNRQRKHTEGNMNCIVLDVQFLLLATITFQVSKTTAAAALHWYLVFPIMEISSIQHFTLFAQLIYTNAINIKFVSLFYIGRRHISPRLLFEAHRNRVQAFLDTNIRK